MIHKWTELLIADMDHVPFPVFQYLQNNLTWSAIILILLYLKLPKGTSPDVLQNFWFTPKMCLFLSLLALC